MRLTKTVLRRQWRFLTLKVILHYPLNTPSSTLWHLSIWTRPPYGTCRFEPPCHLAFVTLPRSLDRLSSLDPPPPPPIASPPNACPTPTHAPRSSRPLMPAALSPSWLLSKPTAHRSFETNSPDVSRLCFINSSVIKARFDKVLISWTVLCSLVAIWLKFLQFMFLLKL